MCRISIFLFCIFFPIITLNLYSYEKNFKTDKLYIDSFIHYNFEDDISKYYWTNQYSNSFLSYSVGSISGDTFMEKELIVINKFLKNDLLFRLENYKESGRHLYEKKEYRYFELYKKIMPRVFLGAGADLMPEKEDIDIKGGILVMDTPGYLMVNVISNDFIYDSKNHFEGKTVTYPIAMTWRLLYNFSHFSLYSQGITNNNYKREYPVTSLSSISYDEKNDNKYSASVVYHFISSSSLEYSYSSEVYTRERKGLSPQDIISASLKTNISAVSYFYTHKNFSSKLSADIINAEYNSQEREEILYSALSSYNIGSLTLKGGYIFSKYKIDDTQSIDKVILGLRYNITSKNYFEFTAGHLNEKGEFGGGNIKLFMQF